MFSPYIFGYRMLKKKLKTGQLSVGSWITLNDPAVAEIFANAGYEWLVIDLEHSSLSIQDAGQLIRVIDLAGSTPLVRLTSNDPNQIKRVLDAGAHGIVVPMVNSAEDAVRAISATRYAPDGTRGVGLSRAQGYGQGFADYLEWQKNSLVVIPQIEHIDAVNNLESILSVPGVDGYIIGPYDLSCSMGIPGEFDNLEFVAVMETIRDVGKKMGCSGGLHIVEPDVELLRKTISDGYLFIAYSVDFRMLDVSARVATSEVLGVSS
jgi:2-keto-3-deoxy-L-rhamnonate aldolase RhmA